jgi:uncharacterized protein involved in high-affinity Fe2+ transport
MHTVRNMALLLGLICAIGAPAAAAEMAPIKQEAQTGHYRLELQIGPIEKMFTPEDVAAKNPTEGEVMVEGTMSMGMSSMAMNMEDTRHLEVHIYSLDKGAVVTDARVGIAVTNIDSKKPGDVSAAKMYGIKEGPSDTHYGDNVSLPPGNYGVEVTVNGEKATFKVAVPAS